jgi:metal-responsive CopG/Arc/MetJ family transcriptional regulator
MVRRIAVSMPEPMYAEMERARGTRGKDRSAWVQDAIAERLRRERRESEVAAYVRAYRVQPETEEEMAETEAWLAAGPLYDEEWPEAPE